MLDAKQIIIKHWLINIFNVVYKKFNRTVIERPGICFTVMGGRIHLFYLLLHICSDIKCIYLFCLFVTRICLNKLLFRIWNSLYTVALLIKKEILYRIIFTEKQVIYIHMLAKTWEHGKLVLEQCSLGSPPWSRH